MAIFKSIIMPQASGSLGGIVFSRNKGGAYVRARAIPTNPNTAQQVVVRQAVGNLANLWSNTLTAAQRAAWKNYADNVPVVNALGDSIILTGLNMYTRSNVPIIQAGLTRVDAAPTVFNLGDYTEPSIAIDATDDEIDVTFDNTDAWANEDDAAMLVYASRPVAASINYFKGPYRYAGKIDGDGATPPTSPAAISLPWAVEAGQKVFAKIAVVRADGRLSYPFRGGAVGA